MKNYNYTKARKLIEDNKHNLTRASLGMHEDWFLTAETIWENGKYNKNLLLRISVTPIEKEYIRMRKDKISIFDDRYNKFNKIFTSGLLGSDWATPTLSLEFKDGKERMVPCYYGENKEEKPAYFRFGCLSGPAQENIKELETV